MFYSWGGGARLEKLTEEGYGLFLGKGVGLWVSRSRMPFPYPEGVTILQKPSDLFSWHVLGVAPLTLIPDYKFLFILNCG